MFEFFLFVFFFFFALLDISIYGAAKALYLKNTVKRDRKKMFGKKKSSTRTRSRGYFYSFKISNVKNSQKKTVKTRRETFVTGGRGNTKHTPRARERNME